MTRPELEHAIWRALRDLRADRHPAATNVVDNLLDAADAYAWNREQHNAVARLAAMQRDTPERQAERRAALETR